MACVRTLCDYNENGDAEHIDICGMAPQFPIARTTTLQFLPIVRKQFKVLATSIPLASKISNTVIRTTSTVSDTLAVTLLKMIWEFFLVFRSFSQVADLRQTGCTPGRSFGL